MKISVIGAGYVGLISGACFAKLGHDVVLIDIDAEKLEAIARNEALPIHEEGLQELLKEVRIETSRDYDKTAASEVILICVGTTADENGSIFSEHLVSTAEKIAEVLKKRSSYGVIAVKSTVGVGMEGFRRVYVAGISAGGAGNLSLHEPVTHHHRGIR
jgi:UDPglucose 6-dehydrogenase